MKALRPVASRLRLRFEHRSTQQTSTQAQRNGTSRRSHNRCPRFQVIDKAVSDELAAAGVTSEMLSNFTDQPQLLLDQYNEDPSEFCAKAWRRLGPNGTYKRQMLEAK
jgi:hypothetical protein